MSFLTRNTTLAQYETALWFVRFMHYKSGIVASPLEYLDYYNGFQRTANRDGAKYPEYISTLTFAIALLAWQNNPNRSV